MQELDPTPAPLRFDFIARLITVAVVVGLFILLLTSITHILTPFVAAIITAYLLNPIVTWLQNRTRIRRAFWIVILYVLTFMLIYALWIWLWPRVFTQYVGLANQIPTAVGAIAHSFEGSETWSLGAGITINLAPLEQQVITAISELGRTLSEQVPHLVFSALETVIFTLVYLIITFYLLLESAQLQQWAIGLVPALYRSEIGGLGHQIDQVFAAYVRGQLVLIVIMSVLLYIPLSILSVPYALVIAIASGTLEIIPIIGPWSAAGIAIVVALFQSSAPFGFSPVGLATLIGVIYFVLRQIEDHFIIPNVMGPLVRLHPAVVIFAILAGGALAGPFGLFISIPTAAVFRILLRYLYGKVFS